MIKDPYGRKPPDVKVQEESPVPKYYDKPLFDECEKVEWEEVYIVSKDEFLSSSDNDDTI